MYTNPMHTAVVTQWGGVYGVDFCATIEQMRKDKPFFFKHPHGKRETLDVYRGCLIVRNTQQFTGQKPVRKTQVYLWGYRYGDDGHKERDTLDCYCVSWHENKLNSKRDAEKFIDMMLESGLVCKKHESGNPPD